MTINTNDVRLQTVNISWSLQSHSIYTLTIVTGHNTQSQILQLDQPYYVFMNNASEGIPPCEVYNFSVTATYVGATNTGAGCSVPSSVISRMLPSLPDISGLVSSINVSLENQSTRITLTTSFQVLVDKKFK